jgi:threonine dehydratase
MQMTISDFMVRSLERYYRTMDDIALPIPDYNDAQSAYQRIRNTVVRTPLMRSDHIDQLTGAKVWFKCEHLQHTGSFKFRGASNAVALLPDDCPGVATHSSGNHGAALAYAARQRGLSADIVMPSNAVRAKMDAVRRFGGRVHLCDPTQAAREQRLAELAATGLAVIPPFDDKRVIAGQASCAFELMEQCPDLDIILSSVGGGGLLAGALLANSGHPSSALNSGQSSNPLQSDPTGPQEMLGVPVSEEKMMGVPVFGVEPEGADDTARAFASGQPPQDHHPQTMADGLRMQVGQLNLAIIRHKASGIITVSEEQIVDAMVLLWAELKQVVEPSGAVALAGLLAQPERFAGKQVGVILSGGNLDIEPQLRGWLR